MCRLIVGDKVKWFGIGNNIYREFFGTVTSIGRVGNVEIEGLHDGLKYVIYSFVLKKISEEEWARAIWEN